MRPVVLSQAQIHGRAVDRVKRIVKFESVPLPPCGKMLAAAVPGGRFRLFVETISGDELEKRLKDAIAKYYRSYYARIKDVRRL